MRAKRGKRKAAPAIVPRFLKNAVTVGAIPALAASCGSPHRVQPVVAYFAPPSPGDANDGTNRPPPPVVAAYQPPVVAAYANDSVVAPPPPDAAPPADAAKRAKSAADASVPLPPPPVVAAMIPNPGPAVVAAYVPRDRSTLDGAGSNTTKPKSKKP
jgi:hypothetical protein